MRDLFEDVIVGLIVALGCAAVVLIACTGIWYIGSIVFNTLIELGVGHGVAGLILSVVIFVFVGTFFSFWEFTKEKGSK